ncbi:MAG: DUF4135 domain-containing protein, partial [Anaerolineae bacterium]
TLNIALKTFHTITNTSPEIEGLQGSYIAFVDAMFVREMEGFFVEYAVLARLLSTATLFWIDGTAEIMGRLSADYKKLRHQFEAGSGISPMDGLKFGLSDPHYNGRTVILLQFGGKEIFYKPKSLALGIALNEWFNWIHAYSKFAFPSLKIQQAENYGWMEYIERGQFNTSKQISHYYQNSGRFLALIHTLAANDCHSGNVINDGKQPVLVDAETLMHHRVPDIEYHFLDARAAAHAILENSVLRTQFLPKWELGGNGQLVDMSALGNEAISPNDYEAEIISGFTERYRFLMAHREELLAEGSPLEGFKNQRVRYVFRPTQTYQTVLQHTLQPRYLHE